MLTFLIHFLFIYLILPTTIIKEWIIFLIVLMHFINWLAEVDTFQPFIIVKGTNTFLWCRAHHRQASIIVKYILIWKCPNITGTNIFNVDIHIRIFRFTFYFHPNGIDKGIRVSLFMRKCLCRSSLCSPMNGNRAEWSSARISSLAAHNKRPEESFW